MDTNNHNTYVIKKSIIPTHCCSPLIHKDTFCKNHNSYMFILSTGEQLFSCAIKKHINYIKNLSLHERTVYVFKKNCTDKNYDRHNYIKYDYKYDVKNVETKFENPNVLKSIIGYTYKSCNLINDCFTKMVELNVLMQNVHLNQEIFRLIEKEYDNNVALSIRYNSLVEINQEYNSIYKQKFIIYKFPFTNSNICSICFEQTSNASGGNLPCGHAFHLNCISSWFNSLQGEIQHCCPNCRNNVDISKNRFCRKISV